MTTNLGSRLRAARKNRDWSQTELASRSGVSTATISAIEARDSAWTKYAFELANALGVREEWLVRGTGRMWRNDPPTQPAQSGEPDEPGIERIDAGLLEDILDAIELRRKKRGDPHLSNADMARLISDSYADVTRTLREERRRHVQSTVEKTVRLDNSDP